MRWCSVDNCVRAGAWHQPSDTREKCCDISALFYLSLSLWPWSSLLNLLDSFCPSVFKHQQPNSGVRGIQRTNAGWRLESYRLLQRKHSQSYLKHGAHQVEILTLTEHVNKLVHYIGDLLAGRYHSHHIQVVQEEVNELLGQGSGCWQLIKMPPTLSKSAKLSHEQNRYKCCALCYNESGNKASCPVSPRVAEIIRTKVDASYELNNSRYAASLCTACDVDINLLGKNKIQKLRFNKSSKFGETIPLNLRSDGPADICHCIICERATLNGTRWLAFRKMWKKTPGRPSTNAGGDNKSVRCNICLTEVFTFNY